MRRIGRAGTDATPSPSCVPCVEPAFGRPPQILHPQNGATGVHDGNFTLVLSDGIGPYGIVTTNESQILTLTAVPVPSPLPSPSASAPPGALPAAYSVPALQVGTTYYVAQLFVQANCPTIANPFGAFATQ